MSETKIRSGRGYTEMRFKASGVVCIEERKPRKSHELVNIQRDIGIEFGYSNDPEYSNEIGFFIEVFEGYIKNENTGRAFRITLRVRPSRDRLIQIRDYVNFLIQSAEGEI